MINNNDNNIKTNTNNKNNIAQRKNAKHKNTTNIKKSIAAQRAPKKSAIKNCSDDNVVCDIADRDNYWAQFLKQYWNNLSSQRRNTVIAKFYNNWDVRKPKPAAQMAAHRDYFIKSILTSNTTKGVMRHLPTGDLPKLYHAFDAKISMTKLENWWRARHNLCDREDQCRQLELFS